MKPMTTTTNPMNLTKVTTTPHKLPVEYKDSGSAGNQIHNAGIMLGASLSEAAAALQLLAKNPYSYRTKNHKNSKHPASHIRNHPKPRKNPLPYYPSYTTIT